MRFVNVVLQIVALTIIYSAFCFVCSRFVREYRWCSMSTATAIAIGCWFALGAGLVVQRLLLDREDDE
jgi:hypothetical protein